MWMYIDIYFDFNCSYSNKIILSLVHVFLLLGFYCMFFIVYNKSTAIPIPISEGIWTQP